MYVICNVASEEVEGSREEKSLSQTYTVNGKFYVPVPPGVSLSIESGAALFPQSSSTSVPNRIANGFLDRFPNYDHVVWNFFLETADMALLDYTTGVPSPTAANVQAGTAPTAVQSGNGCRFQVGRATGPAPTGTAPGSVAIFPLNDKNTGTDTYGSLITDTIDLTSYTGASGTDEVLIWWKVAEVSTSEDVVQGYNVTANTNTPSLRSLEETTQSPTDFRVYASVDDGVSWYECTYMNPTDLANAGTDLRIAFVNESSTKLSLLGFAVLFPNT